jgi:hypothetical protein
MSSEGQAAQIQGTSGGGGFLARLKEYKELISILVFFIGGALWIFAFFATRNQLEELHCLMNANMNFIQGRMEVANLSDLMVQNITETTSLDSKPSLSADEKIRRGKLQVGAGEITRKLTAAETATAQALNNLQAGSCSK